MQPYLKRMFKVIQGQARMEKVGNLVGNEKATCKNVYICNVSNDQLFVDFYKQA